MVPRIVEHNRLDFIWLVKSHIHEGAEPRNVTNLYVWTMKTSSLSMKGVDCQTIGGDPFFVSFSAKHEFRATSGLKFPPIRQFGMYDEICAALTTIIASQITSNLMIRLNVCNTYKPANI